MAKTVVVDETGVVALSLEEQEAQQQERMRGVWGDDLTRSPQTPPNQIAGIQALGLTETGEAVVQDGNANSVDHANGTQLAVLGSNLDVERLEATRSRVTATLTGVAGTGVPAGSRAQTTAGGVRDAGRRGAVAVWAWTWTCRRSRKGRSRLPQARSRRSRRSSTDGRRSPTQARPWWGVRGRRTWTTGRPTRCGRPTASIGPMPALEAALTEALSGKLTVVENNTAAAITTQEFNVHAHSVLAIVESGSDGDVQRAVENHRGMGVGTVTALRGGTPDNGALDSVSNGIDHRGRHAVRRAEPGTGEHGHSEGDGALHADRSVRGGGAVGARAVPRLLPVAADV